MKWYSRFTSDKRARKSDNKSGMNRETLITIIKLVIGVAIVVAGCIFFFNNIGEDITVSNIEIAGVKVGYFKGAFGVVLVIIGGIIIYKSANDISIK